MNRKWMITLIAALGVATIALASALTIVVATDDDSGSSRGATTANFANCGMGWGMMAGRGDWSPETMRAYMQSELGEDGYQRMIEYMRAYSSGTDLSGYQGNGAAWQMMDSMMRGWDRDDWDRCWGWMMQ